MAAYDPVLVYQTGLPFFSCPASSSPLLPPLRVLLIPYYYSRSQYSTNSMHNQYEHNFPPDTHPTTCSLPHLLPPPRPARL